MNYEQAMRSTWRHAQGRISSDSARLRELVRYATLAPSSHNTQCWRFRVSKRTISILPDFSRRCPIVDPDDHHLFVSLGCAAENLLQAARAYGFRGTVYFEPVSDTVRIELAPAKAAASPLFDAIPKRQSTRTEYDGKPLGATEMKLLETAGGGETARILMLTRRSEMESALDYVVQGNTAQMKDPAFVRELKSWIRFSDNEAVRTGDGLFGRTSGNPSVPMWLGSPLFGLMFRPRTENDKYARQLRSSAGVAVFVSDKDDKAHWMEVGRCYERFALQATALGIRNAFVNQPVEVASLRPEFARYLGLDGARPDLVVRFGRGRDMPRSLRRPVEAVLL